LATTFASLVGAATDHIESGSGALIAPMSAEDAVPMEDSFTPSAVTRSRSSADRCKRPTRWPWSSRSGDPLFPGRMNAVVQIQSPSDHTTSPAVHFFRLASGCPTIVTWVPSSAAGVRESIVR
jgi:hypothetical protein